MRFELGQIDLLADQFAHLVLLFFDRRHSPERFRRLVVPVAILWISTIYLRYHYFVDVLAGFALAFPDSPGEPAAMTLRQIEVNLVGAVNTIAPLVPPLCARGRGRSGVATCWPGC